MPPDFSQILYLDSPFLPTINKFHTDNLNDMVNIGRHGQLFSLVHELCEIGIDQNRLHFQEIRRIKKTFNIGANEVTNFFFGFTTPPSLIMGAELLKKNNVSTVIQKICKATTDPLELKINQYKANMLLPLYLRISDIPNHEIAKKIIVTMEICEEKPFSNNFYYLAGQASCLRTGLSLIPSLP